MPSPFLAIPQGRPNLVKAAELSNTTGFQPAATLGLLLLHLPHTTTSHPTHTLSNGTPTIEPLTGAQALCGHPHLHGATDVACLLSTVGQEGQELLGCAANHGLECNHTLP